MTAILRAIGRAKIPIAYSSGFHPHPKISFGPALSAGVEGLNEFFDMELKCIANTSDIVNRMNSALPNGINVLSTVSIPINEISLNEFISCYEYEIVIDKSMKKQINFFMSQKSCLVSRDNRTVDIRPLVKKAVTKDSTMKLILIDTDKAKARLHEILKVMLQKTTDEIQAILIKRIGIYGYNKAKQICL
jgi:radical SAM-linked protein